MEQDKLWAKFARTGKVKDYLEYCGVDVSTVGENSVAPQGEECHEPNHRRIDHPGKQ